MGETRATVVGFPSGRYGRRRSGKKQSRILVGFFALVVFAAGLAISVKLYDQYGRGDLDWDVLEYNISETSVDVAFVVYKAEGADVTCLVRARSADGAEVGHANVTIPAGDSTVEVVYTLETSARPVTGEVQRCYEAR